MSKVINGIIIFENTRPLKCEYCGSIAELRPYGKENENICYECGKKDIKTTEAKIHEHLTSKATGFNPLNN